ncbi:MAG: IS1595 family transposase [Vicinamibacterales bacterium]
MPPANRNKPVRAKSSESQYSLMEFMADFPDDAACLDWLWRNRYSVDGIHADCPKCAKRTEFARYTTSQQRQSWTCTACGHHLHPTAGTIFHKSSTSLHLWFYAMYLMTSTRCGISAKQMERELGVTYKTAWRMAFLIRHKLMTQDGGPLEGEQPIEMDETYFGGRRKPRYSGEKRVGRPGPDDTEKKPIFGMVERRGRVVALATDTVRSAELLPLVQARILPGSMIYTDEFRGYDPITQMGYEHKRIKHSERVYVSGDVHTNTIEGFWSLVKRGIGGVFHSVSTKHLQGYLNEYAWRYNQRFEDRDRFQLLLLRAVRFGA